MRVVAALGGNALLRRGEAMTPAHQRANVRRAASALAPLRRAGHELIVTHGNGPQVGLLALQAMAGPADAAPPLDVLGAESEGMIGYLIEQELDSLLSPDMPVAALLTLVLVDSEDPAFSHPTKPIGPLYDRQEAERMAALHGWSLIADGAAWRRAVPSPLPIAILELKAIELLVRHGVTVICAGGGGIPVSRLRDGSLAGIEAVIDKDRVAALLARELAADCLLLLTDVEAVYLDWSGPQRRAIASAGAEVLCPDDFAAGSMRPKLEAAIAFARQTGRPAAIGQMEDAEALLSGTAGTRIEAGRGRLTLRP